MHIPDGYLSPSTSIAMYAFSAPFLAVASKKIQKKLNSKSIPMIGVFGALSFLVMMFNIPLLGGTTGHAVGSTIAAIILGPWLSMVAISVALVIQALFFGDGGVLSLGANIFNMAVVMPLIGYGIFQLLQKISLKSGLQALWAGIAGYVALNIAALLTAIELGIQPLLFKSPTGQSLYFPYALTVAVPAMMIGHLLIAGFAEAIITFFSYSWIARFYPELVRKEPKVSKNFSWRPVFIILSLMIIIVPVGLLAPGTAWGEWGREELAQLGLGYIPSGYDAWSSLFQSPIPDYNIPFLQNETVSYIVSALLGVGITIAVVYIFSYFMKKISSAAKSS